MSASPYYQVFVDGVSIYDPTEQTKVLINPVLRPSIDEAGSFDFTMGPSHDSYSDIVPYGSDVEVWEDGDPIFWGRALPPSVSAYRMKTYHCEGLVAFLNDIVIPPLSKYVYNLVSGEETTTGFTDGTEDADTVQRVMYMDEYLQWVFSKYNELQTKPSRQMTLRTLELAANPALPYASDYKSALQIIREEILPYTGGYLYATKVNGEIIVDIKQTFGESNQTIKAGVNLVDFSESQQGFYTAVIAKGGKAEWSGEEEPVQLDAPITMSQDIINRYGVICAYKYFPEATTISELQSKCNTFLASQQFAKMIYDVSALDLHILDDEYDRLSVGNYVRFESPIPGETAVEMMVSEAEIHLDTGEKRVSLGEKDRNKLTQKWASAERGSGSHGGAQNDIIVDQSIREGSSHPVSGGAVYDAIQNYGEGGGDDEWHHWFGTLEQYQALGAYNNRTIYFIASSGTVDEYFIYREGTL